MINKLFNFYSNQKTWGLLIGSNIDNLKKIKQPFWSGRADPFIYNFEDKFFIEMLGNFITIDFRYFFAE